MTDIEYEKSATTNLEAGPRNTRRLKQLGVAAFILNGPVIGALIGLHYSSGEDARIAKSEAVVTQEQTQLLHRQDDLTDLLNSRTPACATAVKAYLPGGPNEQFDDSTATVSLQTSTLCSPTDITILTSARDIRRSVTAIGERLGQDEAKLHQKESQNRLNDMTVGAELGVLGDLGELVAAGCLYLLTLDDI